MSDALTVLRNLTESLINRDVEIKRRKEQLEVIFTGCPDMLVIFEGPLIGDCNQRTLKELGYTREELVGKAYMELVHPDDLSDTVEASLQPEEVVDRTGGFWFTNRWRKKDGGYAIIKWSGWLDESFNGIGFGRVITEEERHKEERASLAAHLLDHSPVMSCVATLTPPVFQVLSKSWEKELGWTLEEMRSQPFTNFIHPDDLAKTGGEIVQMASSEDYTVENFENRYRCKDGTYKTLIWNTRFLNGKAYGAAKVIK